MRIAIAQMGSRAGSFAQTVERMLAQARVAASQDARLIAYPAPVLCGCDARALADDDEFFSDCAHALGDLARDLPIRAVVPVLAQAADAPYEEVVYIEEGRLVPLRMAAAVARGDDSEQATAADLSQGAIGFTVDGASLGVALGLDGLDDLKDSGLDLDAVLYLPFSGFSTDDESTALAPAVANGGPVASAASSLNAWMVAVGAVGAYGEQVFCGGSFVMAPWGELACALPSFEEALVTCEVNISFEGPLDKPVNCVPYKRAPFLWEALVLAVRDMVFSGDLVASAAGQAGGCGACVALTGDLASSVVAAIACDALGPTRVRGLIVGHGDADAVVDARELAHNLRIETSEMTMRDVSDAVCTLGLDASDPCSAASVVACALAGMARRLGYVALSCADKTEWALEGDLARAAAGSLAPVGDVYRSDLIALALARNTVSPVIPAACLARYRVPDVAGIGFAGITRESRVSAVDAVLLLTVEQGVPVGEVASGQAHAQLAEGVCDRLRSPVSAARDMPACPTVSGRTLSEDAWPLGFAWRDHPRDTEERSRDGKALDSLADGAQDAVRRVAAEQGSRNDEQVGDVIEMLRDLMDGAGLKIEGEDPWGSGLFSEN